MKIKRFTGKDMRTTLAQVKDTLGPDAVIMSNKKLADGIEIIAAMDNEAPKPKFGKVAQKPLKPANEQSELNKPQTSSTHDPESLDSLQALLERQQARFSKQIKPTLTEDSPVPDWAKELKQPKTRGKHKAVEQLKTARQPKPKAKQQAVSTRNAKSQQLDELKQELGALKALLTHQMSHLMTERKQRTDPVGAMLEKRLIEAEFSPAVAAKLASLSQDYAPTELVQMLPRYLDSMLDSPKDEIVQQGGVVAFVGPTGVGKTTTLAKIAARFAALYGADQLGMISTDHYRIGAYEQLATYGRIIGCSVKQINDEKELEQALYQFRNRQLVLIDTAGMGQRDMRLSQQLDNLVANKRIPVRSYLVMSATAQRPVMQDAVNHFQRIELQGAILTKLDEAVSLAGALSVLIQNSLPLTYITNGQRVPEDIKVADTLFLATQALSALDGQANTDVLTSSSTNWSDNLAYEAE